MTGSGDGGLVDGVSVDTADLAAFVEGGQVLARTLAEIGLGLEEMRARLYGAGLDPAAGAPSGLATQSKLEALHDAVVGTNRLVEGVRQTFDALEVVADPVIDSHRSMLTRELVEGLTSGELSPVSDEVRDAVAQAMLEAKTPSEVGVDARYFPPEYREVVEALEAGGAGRGDREVEEVLERAGLVGRDAGLVAIDLTGGFLGGTDWTGEALARWYLDGGPVTEDVALARMLGEQLNLSPATATAFFNTIWTLVVTSWSPPGTPATPRAMWLNCSPLVSSIRSSWLRLLLPRSGCMIGLGS